MPFNSDTYYANKRRKQAKEKLALARDIKARAKEGKAYEWELAHISSLVRLARIDMRLSRTYRSLAKK